MNRNVVGPITPRVVNYRNNGTSRDTYVSYNCGGYHNQKSQTPFNPHYQEKQFALNKLHTRSQNLLNPIMNHYRNDGNGRDVYISCNDGGSSRYYIDKHFDPLQQFQSTLRQYSQIVEAKNYQNDSFTQSQLLMSKKDAFRNQKIAQSQRHLINRLYQKLPPINKN